MNIANPATGGQKQVDLDDEKRLRAFYDKRLAQEVEGEHISDEFDGYVMKIVGGQDKEGFTMKQGVLSAKRVRLLLHKGVVGCRGYDMRRGERKRKSVRGCIVSSSISVLNLVIVKNGPQVITGLTDKSIPRRLGPKRASKIRKMFNLNQEDDVRKYVIRREVPGKEGNEKTRSKAPKIQRLVTPVTLQRKRRLRAKKIESIANSRRAKAEYEKLLMQRSKEAKESRRASLSRRKSLSKKKE